MKKRSIATPLILGIAASCFIVVLNGFVHNRFDFNLFIFWLNFIIPIGTFGGGFVAAMGFVVGARVAEYPANTRLLIAMIVTGVVAGLGHHVFRYFTGIVDGVPLSQLFDFSTYMSTILAHASMQSGIGGGSTHDIGRVGYLLFIGEILGFAGGMYCGHWVLKFMPHCDKCQNYFGTIFSRTINFANVTDLTSFLATMPEEPRGRVRIAEMCTYVHPNFITKRGTYRWELRHRRCDGCGDEIVAESARMKGDRQFLGDARFRREYQLKGNIIKPRPAVPLSAPVRTFGRRLG